MTKISLFSDILVFCVLLIFLSSCEALKYKKTGPGEVPVNADDRVAKNIEPIVSSHLRWTRDTRHDGRLIWEIIEKLNFACKTNGFLYFFLHFSIFFYIF